MNSQDENDHTHNHFSHYCPSFSTYTSNNRITDIADRVLGEPTNLRSIQDEADFEFDFGNAVSGSLPVYPVFDRDLLRDLGSVETATATVQLRNLFFEEDATTSNNYISHHREAARSSCASDSSSVVGELDGVSPRNYCLWAPKSPSRTPSPSRCMKSSSTGSGPVPAVSKTWKLRNLLRRCKSDGKEGLMLMTATPSKKNKEKVVKEKSSSSSPLRSPLWGGSKGAGEKRRKSYLPYKQDLLGFFGSPQTLRKISIPPF